MMSHLPIKFLQQKIQELQSALFVTESNTVLKMPTHVISGAEVDDAGQIWFLIPKPSQRIDAFEKEFPAKLDFFRKGKGFYMKVHGKASIVADSGEMSNIAGLSEEIKQKVKSKDTVAIKMKVQNGDYYENVARRATSNWILSGTTHLYNWLFNSQYDNKNPQLVTIPITLD
ncbi:MAG TPA: pyridoxamine 5'-phosphate oxidase family protein [Puia sp.]|nr:pyridoxamine 5'-phosphate oxidase family protein [Puia sp.]